MNATTRIRRQGGAAVVTIPSPLVKEMGVEVGTGLALSVSDGELVARPVRAGKKRCSHAVCNRIRSFDIEARVGSGSARFTERLDATTVGEIVARVISAIDPAP